MNAVLALPPELPTSYRIANALGEVGHLSLAAAAQNLLLLWSLSKLVSPGISEFCAFAAVALVFDFLFHLTFFLGVLAVDVKRMELQDSLSKVNDPGFRTRSPQPRRQRWIDAFMQGKLPFSTRIAGSAIMMCFVVGLNYQYVKKEHQAFSLFRFVLSSLPRSRSSPASSAMSPPQNQTRTPLAWLKMQDQSTAREAIRLVKPNSHSFIARLYEPLVIVLENADRRPSTNDATHWLASVRHLAEEHLFPFALAIVFVVAFVALLMNFLLWDEIRDEQPAAGEGQAGSQLHVRTLARSQDLDVVQLVVCPDACILSIALDRSMSIWQRQHDDVYHQTILGTDALFPWWPVAAAAFDPYAQAFALCSRSGHCALWSLSDRRISHSFLVDLQGQQPLAVELEFSSKVEIDSGFVVVIRPDGRLIETSISSGLTSLFHLCNQRLVHVQAVRSDGMKLWFIALDDSGGILLLRKSGEAWSAEATEYSMNAYAMSQQPSVVHFVLFLAGINVVLIEKWCEVEILDMTSRSSLRRIQTGEIKVHTLRAFHAPPRKCSVCGTPATASLAVAYTEHHSQKCVMHTFTPRFSQRLLCLRTKAVNVDSGCERLAEASEALYWVDDCGAWELTGDGQDIIGVRKQPSSAYGGTDHGLVAAAKSGLSKGVKHRRPNVYERSAPLEPENEWEAWHLSSKGDFETISLLGNPEKESRGNQLLVTRPGPICSAGPHSVAVGFGNTVKVISSCQGRPQQETLEACNSGDASKIVGHGRRAFYRRKAL